MISSVYDFVSQLIGHIWQSGTTQGDQTYLYTTACVIVILAVVATIDLIYRIASAVFDFKL